jgi:hypothetical protein
MRNPSIDDPQEFRLYFRDQENCYYDPFTKCFSHYKRDNSINLKSEALTSWEVLGLITQEKFLLADFEVSCTLSKTFWRCINPRITFLSISLQPNLKFRFKWELNKKVLGVSEQLQGRFKRYPGGESLKLEKRATITLKSVHRT